MTTTLWFLDTVDTLNDYLWTYVVVVMLVACAIYFTFRSKGVQFRLLRDMVKVIVDRPIYNKVGKDEQEKEAFFTYKNEIDVAGAANSFLDWRYHGGPVVPAAGVANLHFGNLFALDTV